MTSCIDDEGRQFLLIAGFGKLLSQRGEGVAAMACGDSSRIDDNPLTIRMPVRQPDRVNHELLPGFYGHPMILAISTRPHMTAWVDPLISRRAQG